MREISMNEIINDIVIPNFFSTLRMMIFASIMSVFLGFILGMFMYVTSPNGLKPNDKIYSILNLIISIIRSFPFVILMVALIPLTRFITGSSIGWKAALVPMTIAGTPILARMYENSLKETNPALVEATKSFGASVPQIIYRVAIPDTVPSLISSTTLGVIQILSYSATAGTVGAGGLGAAALTYGYQSFNYEVMYLIIVVLFVLVLLIQLIGDFVYKKLS